jgi:hypothetical protein
MPAYLDPAELLAPVEGIYYEPRALWGSALLGSAQNPRGSGLVQGVSPFETNAFYNGERYPYTFTHVIMQWCEPGGFLAYNTPRLGAQVGVSIGKKGMARFGKSNPPFLLNPIPVQEPLNPDAALRTGLPTINTCRWEFEHACVVPADTQLEIMVGARLPTPTDTTASTVTADVNLYAPSTAPANFPGNAFTAQQLNITQLTVNAAQNRFAAQSRALTQLLVSEAGGEFTPPPATPFAGYTGGTETMPFPPRSQLSPVSSLRQKANYTAPARLGGFSVTFDERGLDPAEREAIGPLAATTPIRIRSRNGGTGAFWWRDGAPLSIVSPTMSPAHVSRLSMPLSLAPGEAFEVTLLPQLGAPLNGISSDDEDLDPGLFYISFCGFAAVQQ